MINDEDLRLFFSAKCLYFRICMNTINHSEYLLFNIDYLTMFFFCPLWSYNYLCESVLIQKRAFDTCHLYHVVFILFFKAMDSFFCWLAISPQKYYQLNVLNYLILVCLSIYIIKKSRIRLSVEVEQRLI